MTRWPDIARAAGRALSQAERFEARADADDNESVLPPDHLRAVATERRVDAAVLDRVARGIRRMEAA